MGRQTSNQFKHRLGVLLRTKREAQRPELSQGALGALVSRSEQMIRKYEQGRAMPGDETLRTLCSVLVISEGDIDELGPRYRDEEDAEPGRIHAHCKFTDKMDEDWGAFVRERRGRRGLDQHQFAEEAGISIEHLARMEGGQVPTKDTVEDLALSVEENMHDWLSAAGHDANPTHHRSRLERRRAELDENTPSMLIPIRGQLEDHAVTLWDASEGAEVIPIPVLKGVPVPDFALRVGEVPTRQFAEGDILVFREDIPIEILRPGDLVLATGTGRTGPAGDAEGPGFAMGEFRGVTDDGRIRLRELTTKKRKAIFAGDEVYAGMLVHLAFQPLADRVSPRDRQAVAAEPTQPSRPRRKRAAARVPA